MSPLYGALQMAVYDINGVKVFLSDADFAALKAMIGTSNAGGATGLVAFAGGGAAGALLLPALFNDVTTVVTKGDSVILPVAALGESITVKNSGATTLAVFPATGGTINALAANLSIDIAPGSEKGFKGISATQWRTSEVLTLNAPTTQTGAIAIQSAASAGDFVTTVTNASQAAARTYTIPDAGANASFLMSQGATSTAGVYTPTGGIAAAGGFTQSPRLIATGSAMATVSTQGADYTVVNTEVMIGECFVEGNVTATGVALLNGSAVAGNVKVGLCNSAGVVLATSVSTAQAGISTYQLINFTAPIALIGPATYYIVAMGDTNGGTSKIRAHLFGAFGAAKQTGQVYATGFTTIAPATTFTATVAPIASLF